MTPDSILVIDRILRRIAQAERLNLRITGLAIRRDERDALLRSPMFEPRVVLSELSTFAGYPCYAAKESRP